MATEYASEYQPRWVDKEAPVEMGPRSLPNPMFAGDLVLTASFLAGRIDVDPRVLVHQLDPDTKITDSGISVVYAMTKELVSHDYTVGEFEMFYTASVLLHQQRYLSHRRGRTIQPAQFDRLWLNGLGYQPPLIGRLLPSSSPTTTNLVIAQKSFSPLVDTLRPALEYSREDVLDLKRNFDYAAYTSEKAVRIPIPRRSYMRHPLISDGDSTARTAVRSGFLDHTIAAEKDWDGLAIFGLPEPAGELAWQEDALCAQTDPESFFPEKGGSVREAKRICTDCPVRTECLEYAIAHDERFGIWGGLSERERRRVRRTVSV